MLELQSSITVLEKRIKQLESKAALIEKEIDQKDTALSQQIIELDDSMADIFMQVEKLKKETEGSVAKLISTVRNMQDVASSTDLEILKNSLEEFKPENWLSMKEFEKLVNEKIAEKIDAGRAEVQVKQ